jgi:hypothetical protein
MGRAPLEPGKPLDNSAAAYSSLLILAGYEQYDGRLCHLARSLVAALTSADG